MINSPISVTSRVSEPRSYGLETQVSEETKPSPSKAEQSTKGTWIEELQRRHQAALMEEIKEQILFKPTDHFSISSVFDENGGEPFPPRRKSLAAKRRMLDDELEDIREPSTSSSSSSDSQVQQTEPLPSSRADRCSSTMTNDGRPAPSTLQITPSKSKFFGDEPVPESPKRSTGVETTLERVITGVETMLQRVIAIEEAGEGMPKSLRREDTDGARQGDGRESFNALIINAVQEGCRTCGRGTAKVEKACQTVPDYATAGKLFDDCTSQLA
ncbi:hypothetical protein IscW_ISCW018309 [Ixodes scapularis]|uniref:Uncharacterized protein n=1 Tax=Ixodes scapularis TaxID=6945 RepID=B7PGT8_IXOSC|nr:hypothetical protein IscW_ISCW018309 [Ixodes scapularis]|eukprot:XP_002401447.1 hypothetical protein IscW_ISCW018309 [Ixodes scapularis]